MEGDLPEFQSLLSKFTEQASTELNLCVQPSGFSPSAGERKRFDMPRLAGCLQEPVGELAEDLCLAL